MKHKGLILRSENQKNNNNNDNNDNNNDNAQMTLTGMIRTIGMIIMTMKHMTKTDDGADENQREEEDEGEGEMQGEAKANFLGTQKQKI